MGNVVKLMTIFLLFLEISESLAQNTVIPPPNLGADMMGNVSVGQWTATGGSTLAYDSIEGGFPITTDINGMTNHEDWTKSITSSPKVFLQRGKAYQFVLRIKADVFPRGQNIVVTVGDGADHTQRVEYAHNVSQAGVWEYVSIPVIPKKDGNWKVKFIFVHTVLKYDSTPSTIYVDPDIDVYELPPGVEAANVQTINTSTDKDAFESSTQKVDPLGNVYVKDQNSTSWEHIFPKMMYKGYNGAFQPSDSAFYKRYKEYGFNGTMDVWTAVEAQATLDAGMEYIAVSGVADINTYWGQVNQWADAGNHHKNIIWYQFDNENTNVANYSLQKSMGMWASTNFLDPVTNQRRHPIYYLNGQNGLPRTYHNSERDVMDLTGTYAGPSDALGAINNMPVKPNLLIQFLTHNQRAPVVVIQLQSYLEQSFIPSLFHGIIMGGKAMSVWRDGTSMNPNGPDFRQCHWADSFKNEVSDRLDQMLPVIEQPHFTTWTATTNEFPDVRIGTRELNDTAYLILANFDNTDLVVDVNLQGIQADQAVDFFTGAHIAPVTNGTFQCTIGHYNSGYKVIKLVDTAVSSASASICQGDSIMLGGSWQTTAGSYVDNYTAANGGDSTVVTTLVVDSVFHQNITASICAGDSIMLGGNWQTTGGTYTDVYQTSAGCDSVITTVLTVFSEKLSSASASICAGDSILIAGAYRSTAGAYRDTLTAASGCDSIHTVNLSVLPGSSDTVNVSICQGDSVLLGGNWQSTAGAYVDTLLSATGCDSVVTTNLSVSSEVNVSVDASICQGDSIQLGGSWQTTGGTYTDVYQISAGCDSVVTTTLTVVPDAVGSSSAGICAGDSILLGGAYRSVAGVYTDTLSSSAGCDSVVSTTLGISTVDTAMSMKNGVLTASATNASYRWIDCSTDQYIAGETSQSFTPSDNGVYMVEVTENGCTDTSSCKVIDDVSFSNEDLDQLTYHPNPTRGEVKLNLGTTYGRVSIVIINASGKRLRVVNIGGKQKFSIDLGSYADGNYFLHIKTDEGSKVIKVVKE